jgi:TPR repeat protein
MRVYKVLISLAFSMLLGSAVAGAADYDKGLKAYDSGDFNTALAQWMPLAEQGEAGAQYSLGRLYFFGEGVQQSYKVALEWYVRSAEQGFAYAENNLGAMYYEGTGVTQNYETALKWYRLASEQGDADSQNNLGFMYQSGEGVAPDNLQAYMWLSLGALNGDEEAVINKDNLAKQMTPADMTKAQEMSSRCLKSGYMDC